MWCVVLWQEYGTECVCRVRFASVCMRTRARQSSRLAGERTGSVFQVATWGVDSGGRRLARRWSSHVDSRGHVGHALEASASHMRTVSGCLHGSLRVLMTPPFWFRKDSNRGCLPCSSRWRHRACTMSLLGGPFGTCSASIDQVGLFVERRYAYQEPRVQWGVDARLGSNSQSDTFWICSPGVPAFMGSQPWVYVSASPLSSVPACAVFLVGLGLSSVPVVAYLYSS